MRAASVSKSGVKPIRSQGDNSNVSFDDVREFLLTSKYPVITHQNRRPWLTHEPGNLTCSLLLTNLPADGALAAALD
jgi:hypothetical protein